MPFESLHTTPESAWALWKIEEPESELASMVGSFEVNPVQITNPSKRLEYFAGRVLIKRLAEFWQLEFKGLTKDEFGKPFLTGHPFHISLSHSYPYVSAIIHRSKSVGIDLEQPKEKLFRIATRVLHPAEVLDAGSDVVKHCIYWCAKEALIKWYGKKDLALAANLRINAFSMVEKGDLVGRIIVNTQVTTVPLQYYVFENFVVVITL